MGIKGQMGLPHHIDVISFLASAEAAQGALYAVVTPNPSGGTYSAEVVDTSGKKYLQLAGYRTVALVDGVKAESLKALQAVMSLQTVAA
jgi:hypothetical protein